MDMENRLRRLELQLGLDDEISRASAAHTGATALDLAARVNALQQRSTSLVSSTEWKELDELMEELSPGTALTHQKQIIAPILYRRAELLSAAAPLEADLKQVAQILNLLLISSAEPNRPLPMTEQQLLQAPILQTDSATPITEQKVEALATAVADLQSRIHQASTKLDRMVNSYASLVSAVSEKLVLADEVVQMREASLGM